VAELHQRAAQIQTPVLGITGTGGAGKSSLTDELVRRFRLDQDDALRIAVISIDPRAARAAAPCWATASA
jgi:methylmalonyl-CoA mutase